MGPDRSGADAGKLEVLDGLRGVAVLVVLASHYSSAGLFPRPALHGVGKSGVYLFFVLSSYLLTRNLLRLPPASLGEGMTWLDYGLRRVLRIWPLYLVVLAASWVAHGQSWSVLYDLDTRSLWQHLALREGRSVLWSIPVEFKFYFLLPVLALGLAAMARRRYPLILQVAVFIAALVAVNLAWPPAGSVENEVRLWPYLAVFLCGAFAARVDEWQAQATPRPRIWTGLGVLALVAWCLAIPALWCRLRGIPFDASITRTWYLYFGLLWSALLLALVHGQPWLRRCFAWKPLRWVGLVSFSLYLWHMPVLSALLRAGVAERLPWLAPGLVLGLTLAAAWVSWRLFERPLQHIRIRKPL